MKADYGLDAPGLMRGFGVAGLVALAAAIGIWAEAQGKGLRWIGVALGIASLYPLGMASLMVFYSKVTKLADRDQMLAGLDWARIATVVDLGCGRGLMAIGAAQRMTAGTATGVDIWNAADQSGNSPDAARLNAKIAGVAGRVAFVTADMRALPMADGSVDLVVSAWAIHNLHKAEDRARALAEAVRVLAPGGEIRISDIECHADYVAVLQGLGLRAERREFGRVRARVLAAVSFGSFSPAMVVARRA